MLPPINLKQVDATYVDETFEHPVAQQVFHPKRNNQPSRVKLKNGLRRIEEKKMTEEQKH